jgi:hypothetical protein
MFNIIKAAFSNSKFEILPQITIKNACDYIVSSSISTKGLLAVVEKVNTSPAIQKLVKKDIVPVIKRVQKTPLSSLQSHAFHCSKQKMYEFIDEDVPIKSPVSEATIPKVILKRPVLEAVPEKLLITESVNETQLIHKKAKSLENLNKEKTFTHKEISSEPTNPLQLLLALKDPDLMLMDNAQWNSYIHKYITDEYVYIGQNKSMPFYRKRKQLMQDLEALERSKGFKLMDFGNVLNYLAWSYNMQFLVHINNTEKKMKNIRAYPEMHLWNRSTPIYCVGASFVSFLNFNQLRDYLESSEDAGAFIEWPNINGKKTELLTELGRHETHLKKDELSRLVGKKRVYNLFEK